MKSLYKWLIDVKGYSESESHETIIRWDNGMNLPDDVKSDIYEFLKIYFKEYS